MSFRRYRAWQPNEFILCFVDTAWGGTDYTAAQFMSKDKLDVPLVFHSKVTSTEATPQIHLELEKIHDQTGINPVVAYERNNGGHVELERLAALNRHGKYKIYQEKTGVGSTDATTTGHRLGWTTNSATRPAMLSMLKEAIDLRLIRLYDRPTINEMFSFVVVQTSSSWKATAESGAHDDLIMSLAGVWQLYQTEEKPIDHSRLHLPPDRELEELWSEI